MVLRQFSTQVLEEEIERRYNSLKELVEIGEAIMDKLGQARLAFPSEFRTETYYVVDNLHGFHFHMYYDGRGKYAKTINIRYKSKIVLSVEHPTRLPLNVREFKVKTFNQDIRWQNALKKLKFKITVK